VAGLKDMVLDAAGALYARGWEARRAAYARGWKRSERVDARVVSIGNLGVGGAGKTTLVLHLAGLAQQRGLAYAVACRRYRPGPGGHGDEERLYRSACGEARTFAGRSKLALARSAAMAGARLVLVDDGFSHWPLARDLDLVLLDATDLWSGGRPLPSGRMREPHRALQRAGVVIVSRLPAGEDPTPWLDRVRPYAPAALLAAGRHRVTGVIDPQGRAAEAGGPAHVVTATGNPDAVARSAREAGFEPVTLAAYRDHHWFTAAEADREAAKAGRSTLLTTAKDAVRWPAQAKRAPSVLAVRWEWCANGEAVEARVCQGVVAGGA
jgi:tetraacyldisaccharide 4'-kinase